MSDFLQLKAKNEANLLSHSGPWPSLRPWTWLGRCQRTAYTVIPSRRCRKKWGRNLSPCPYFQGG